MQVLDISFNSISDISQLGYLSCFPRLRSLQVNDNPLCNQEEHVEKVLEAVPWLIEVDNEPVEEVFRDKAIKSIFLGVMGFAGVQYLQEKAARAEPPFLNFKNPIDIKRHWAAGGGHVEAPSTSSIRLCGVSTSYAQVVERNVNDIMHGNSESSVLWGAVLEVFKMAETNPVLQNQLSSKDGDNLDTNIRTLFLTTMDANWNCLAFQEMCEAQRKSILFATREKCMRKDFQEAKSGQELPVCEPNPKKFRGGTYDIDLCLLDHLEYNQSKYKEVYNGNVEYRMEVETQRKRVSRLQALARGWLARREYNKLRQSDRALKEMQRQAEALRLRIASRKIQASHLMSNEMICVDDKRTKN